MNNSKKSFIVYLDDNDIKKEAHVDILENNISFVKFSTNKNIITIPFSRILKIKDEKKERESEIYDGTKY